MVDAAINSQSQNLETVVTNVTDVPSPTHSLDTRLEVPQSQRAGEAAGRESPVQSSPFDRLLSPGASSPRRVRLSSYASSDNSRRARHEIWVPRRYHKWKSPLLMSTFFVLGLGMSIGHCAFYWILKDTIVGSPWRQESNLRQAGPST